MTNNEPPFNSSPLLKLLKSQGSEIFHSRPIAHFHDLYISGELLDEEEYVEIFEQIRNLPSTDTLKIHINCRGGNLFTAIQFMRVLHECEATIITSIEGACMSAATLIFLCGDSFEVSTHAAFMIHNYSGGTFGKGGEMIDQLNYEREWSREIWEEAYRHFLSQKEIQSILDGKDLWMDQKEVLKRLQTKVDKMKEELENSIDKEE